MAATSPPEQLAEALVLIEQLRAENEALRDRVAWWVS